MKEKAVVVPFVSSHDFAVARSVLGVKLLIFHLNDMEFLTRFP